MSLNKIYIIQLPILLMFDTISFMYSTQFFVCFVMLLLNVSVNSYGHVGMVAFDFMGLLLDIEMNNTQRPAIQHCPKLRFICRDGPT